MSGLKVTAARPQQLPAAGTMDDLLVLMGDTCNWIRVRTPGGWDHMGRHYTCLIHPSHPPTSPSLSCLTPSKLHKKQESAEEGPPSVLQGVCLTQEHTMVLKTQRIPVIWGTIGHFCTDSFLQLQTTNMNGLNCLNIPRVSGLLARFNLTFICVTISFISSSWITVSFLQYFLSLYFCSKAGSILFGR